MKLLHFYLYDVPQCLVMTLDVCTDIPDILTIPIIPDIPEISTIPKIYIII